MPWWKKSENRPVIAAAVICGLFSTLSALLWLAYQDQRNLRKSAAEEAARAEAAATSAIQAANKGQRAREQSQELVGFIMQDLQDALIPIGQAEVFESVARQTLSYYHNLPPDLITPETELEKATVLGALAHSQFITGKLPKANSSYANALVIIRKLLALNPDDEELQEKQGFFKNEQGLAALAMNDPESALTIYQEVTNGPFSQAVRGSAEFGLGEVARVTGKTTDALAHYNKGARLVENALNEDPQNILWRQTLMTCHNNAGLVALNAGMLDASEASYLRSLKAARKLIEIEPENRNWEKELATLLNNLGGLHQQRDNQDQAATYFDEALSLRLGLVSWDSKNTRWLLDLANSWLNDASIHHHRGDAKKLLSSARNGLRIYFRLLSMEPGQTNWGDEMREFLAIQKKRLEELEQSADAETLSREVDHFIEKLNSGNQDDLVWREAIGGLTPENRSGKNVSRDSSQLLLSAETYARAVDENKRKSESLILLSQTYLELGHLLKEGPDKRKAPACFALAYLALEKRFHPSPSPQLKRLQNLAWREAILSGYEPKVLVKAGAIWKYQDGSDTVDANWHNQNFNDSNWKKGPAPLGYGNGNEATIIGFGNDPENKIISARFRHQFTCNSIPSMLKINIRRDDGAIIFLNGKAILWDGLPTGTTTPSSIATQTIMGLDEEVFEPFEVPGSLLKEGLNTVAVQVHQNEAVSSDLCLDCEIWSADNLPEISEFLPPANDAEELLGEGGLPGILKEALKN